MTTRELAIRSSLSRIRIATSASHISHFVTAPSTIAWPREFLVGSIFGSIALAERLLA